MPVYSDVKSDLSINSRGTPNVLYDEDVIIQSIRTIFATVSGERVRNPIGSALIRLLFEPINNETARDIKYEIRKVIGTHEPRVKVRDLYVRPNYDMNAYDVDVNMVVVGLNKIVNFRKKLRSLTV